MFKDSFIACIKVNGQILREQQNQVRIPFGSEYSILFKNLSEHRARVNIYIDGKDQGLGHGLIIGAKDSVELERPFGDHNSGYKFKFIERTSNIEKHRGVGAEDGIVRIEFEYERPEEKIFRQHDVKAVYDRDIDRFTTLPYNLPQPWYDKHYSSTGEPNPAYLKGTVTCNSEWPTGLINSADQPQFRGLIAKAAPATNAITAQVATANIQGITVAGSESNQKFHTTSGFRHTYVRQILTLQLVGAVDDVPVKEAVTVQTKPKCKTCGRVNKATSKYCSECGTNLAA